MQPKDEDEFVDMLWTMATTTRARSRSVPARRRNGRQAQSDAQTARDRQSRGGATRSGRRDIWVWAACFEMAEEAARKLEALGVSVALINPRWIKPLDTGTLEFFARSVQVLCTIEDHVLHTALAAARNGTSPHPDDQHAAVVRIGWPDQFIEHGTIPILRKKHG